MPLFLITIVFWTQNMLQHEPETSCEAPASSLASTHSMWALKNPLIHHIFRGKRQCTNWKDTTSCIFTPWLVVEAWRGSDTYPPIFLYYISYLPKIDEIDWIFPNLWFEWITPSPLYKLTFIQLYINIYIWYDPPPIWFERTYFLQVLIEYKWVKYILFKK